MEDQTNTILASLWFALNALQRRCLDHGELCVSKSLDCASTVSKASGDDLKRVRSCNRINFRQRLAIIIWDENRLQFQGYLARRSLPDQNVAGVHKLRLVVSVDSAGNIWCCCWGSVFGVVGRTNWCVLQNCSLIIKIVKCSWPTLTRT